MPASFVLVIELLPSTSKAKSPSTRRPKNVVAHSHPSPSGSRIPYESRSCRLRLSYEPYVAGPDLAGANHRRSARRNSLARIDEVWRLVAPRFSIRLSPEAPARPLFNSSRNKSLDNLFHPCILARQGNSPVRIISMKKFLALAVLISIPALAAAQSAGSAPASQSTGATVSTAQDSSQSSTAGTRYRHHRRAHARKHHHRKARVQRQ